VLKWGEVIMLKGKTAVITGCLSGIGRSTLDAFAINGADVFACAQHETDEYANHVEQLSREHGVSVIPIYFDMRSNEAIKNAALDIRKRKLPVNVLVNIAGMNRDALFQMVREEDMYDTFQVNFFSQIIFSQYIVRQMIGKGSGSIINTSSISALDGNEGQLVYASSKAALAAATRTMSAELGCQGIRVNAIAPGVIDTSMTAAVPSDITNAKLERSNLGRIGTPEEVANVIVFLASDLSSHITGQIIRIDGGMG
jgi:3-oxoacyl-[acyl-carrier protein] reductase